MEDISIGSFPLNQFPEAEGLCFLNELKREPTLFNWVATLELCMNKECNYHVNDYK